MRLETIACNQCGAPLTVPEAAQFVRCNHCSASLAVRRSESVTYTEVVEKLVEHTSKLAEQVAHLRYQAELARIDGDWDRERQRHLVSQKNGAPTEPTYGGAVFGGVAMAVVGILAAILGGSGPGGGGFALFGIGAVMLGAFAAIFGWHKAAEFERARKRYKARRARLKIDDFLDKNADESINADEIPPLR